MAKLTEVSTDDMTDAEKALFFMTYSLMEESLNKLYEGIRMLNMPQEVYLKLMGHSLRVLLSHLYSTLAETDYHLHLFFEEGNYEVAFSNVPPVSTNIEELSTFLDNFSK